MQLLDFNEESCVTAASGIRTLYYCGVSLRLFVFDGCMFCFINSFNSSVFDTTGWEWGDVYLLINPVPLIIMN